MLNILKIRHSDLPIFLDVSPVGDRVLVGYDLFNDLKALIRRNQLADVDDAYLRHMAVIHIVPAAKKPTTTSHAMKHVH